MLPRDIRYGLRTLVRDRGFAGVAALTLALGIGASTAVVSAVDAILLRPLPVKDSDRLVTLYSYNTRTRGYPYSFTSYPDFLDYRAHAELFSGLACALNASFTLRAGGEVELLNGALVSPEYFEVLGVSAAAGRMFRAGEGAPVIVLAYSLWERRFQKDPAVIGRAVHLNGQPATVIGIAPRHLSGLRLHESPQVWASLSMLPQVLSFVANGLPRREMRWCAVVGRLRDGISVTQAEAGVRTIARNFERAYPQTHQGWTAALIPTNKDRFAFIFKDRIESFLAMAAAAAGLLLLIACANVANLQLLRAAARQREMAVRLALGAGRGQLIRQLLTESVLLALAGAAAGLAIAVWTMHLMQAFRKPFLAQIVWEPRLDARVLAFTSVLAVISGVVFGLAPALQASRADLASGLKARAAGAAGRSSILSLLVVAQVTLCFVLLIGAGLFLRSLQTLSEVDPGFRARQVLLATMDTTAQGYGEARAAAFWSQLLERVRTIPGVRSVALARTPPLSSVQSVSRFAIDGREITSGASTDFLSYNSVSPGYFETMGIPIVAGRAFSERDRGAAVINESLARACFGGESPLGRRLTAGNRQYEIVGIAKDSKLRNLWEPVIPYVFLPLTGPPHEATLHLAPERDDPGLASAVRREVQALDKDLPLHDVTTLKRQIEDSLAGPRMIASVAAAFGLAALLLAMVGLYGVMSYSVARRAQEIGVRMALGARQGQVLSLFLRRGLRLAAAGGIAGLAGALALSRFAAALLHGVSPTDPPAYALAFAVLAGVALAACYLPARRAARIHPAITLREE